VPAHLGSSASIRPEEATHPGIDQVGHPPSSRCTHRSRVIWVMQPIAQGSSPLRCRTNWSHVAGVATKHPLENNPAPKVRSQDSVQIQPIETPPHDDESVRTSMPVGCLIWQPYRPNSSWQAAQKVESAHKQGRFAAKRSIITKMASDASFGSTQRRARHHRH
jgi:hypothetical protein